MGFGGILASMAQGLGKGMVENVHNGWEDERIQKQLDWRADEYDKQRQFDAQESDRKFQHEKELKMMDGKTEISKAIIAARANANKGGLSEPEKNFRAITQATNIYSENLKRLNLERTNIIENGGDQNALKAIDSKIKVAARQLDDHLRKPSTISAFRSAGDVGEASFYAFGGDESLFNGVSRDPFEGIQKPVMPTSSIGEPKVNKVDIDNLTPEQAEELAESKRASINRLKFTKASDEAKEWAAGRNQYKSSTFIPRTF